MNRSFANITTLVSSFAVAAGLLCAATNASAQNTATVRVPFTFTANHQQVPAGHYKVQMLSDRYVALINFETGRTQTILMVRPESGPAIETRGRLVFVCGDTRNYLTEVRIAGTSMHSELAVRPSLQRELAKSNPPAGSTIEIAMK